MIFASNQPLPAGTVNLCFLYIRYANESREPLITCTI